VPADDRDALLCYRLDAAAVCKLAGLIDATVDPVRFEYFLEGHAFEPVDRTRSGAKDDIGAIPGE
jgi:hypothetical protein